MVQDGHDVGDHPPITPDPLASLWTRLGGFCDDFVTGNLESVEKPPHKHSEIRSFSGKGTLPETDNKFAPENGWFGSDMTFLLGANGLFSGANLLLVSGVDSWILNIRVPFVSWYLFAQLRWVCTQVK